MNQQRRTLMQFTALVGLMASAGLITKAEAATWNKAAFEAKTVADVEKVLGAASVQESDQINLRAPDIAENGAVVPVGVQSDLEGVTQIAILVKENPSAMAAMFMLPAGALPDVTTRIKMGQTSDVVGLVKAGDKWLMASKEIKVTLGGCGG